MNMQIHAFDEDRRDVKTKHNCMNKEVYKEKYVKSVELFNNTMIDMEQ